jgi:ubiquitin-protein ligase
MVTSDSNKRVMRELLVMFNNQNSKDFSELDYIISPESTSKLVKTLLRAPDDSVYRHKFFRLDFHIPDNYPHEPPALQFINHNQSRIHPNMYEDGKCCATILNTWGINEYEKWTSSMSIHSVLISFMSLLDNDPYVYEPGGTGNDDYTWYVEYFTWYTCLLEYFDKETDEIFIDYMSKYLINNIKIIINELNSLANSIEKGFYYTHCYDIGMYYMDYRQILQFVCTYHDYFYAKNIYDRRENKVVAGESSTSASSPSARTGTVEYRCEICYDTVNLYDDMFFIKLDCGHSFHRECIIHHVTKNGELCSKCREDISARNMGVINDKWITNTRTGKRIRINGRTYNKLVKIE